MARLVETACALKHFSHIRHIGHVPIVELLVEGGCAIKHFSHTKSLRRRRRSSKKSKKTFTKQLTKRSKSKKIRGGVTTRNGVRRGNYRFLSTLKAQDLTRVPSDIFAEIREMHPLLTPKLNNSTLRHAVKDYLSSNVKIKRFIILKYGEIGDWDVSNVTDMENMFVNAYSFNQPLNNWNVSNVFDMSFMFAGAEPFNQLRIC